MHFLLIYKCILQKITKTIFVIEMINNISLKFETVNFCEMEKQTLFKNNLFYLFCFQIEQSLILIGTMHSWLTIFIIILRGLKD